MTLERVVKWAGLAAIVIGALAWAMELSGLTYVCPYCRNQRTAILIVGVLMLLPWITNVFLNLFGRAIALFGFVVAAEMFFLMVKDVLDGKWEDFYAPLYENGLLLSAAAMFILIGQIFLLSTLFHSRPLPRFLRPSDV